MNDVISSIKELIGVEFNSHFLEHLYEDVNNPYLQEVKEEAHSIKSNPTVTRTLLQVQESCKKGMLAELILRTNVDNLYPISEETVNKYASKFWLNQNQSLGNAIKYHDLIDELGNVYEVKNWNIQNVHNNIVTFIHDDALNYNHSRYLVVFSEVDENIVLQEVIDIEKPCMKFNTLKLSSNEQTFTIKGKLLELIKKYPKVPIEFWRNETLIGKSTSEWFLKNSQISKFPNGGRYIWSSALSLIL